jgi:hypothetical protein
MTPEELQPLLDALGDVNILENMMEFGGVAGEAVSHNTRAGAKSDSKKGIHYSGAHWFARLQNGGLTDSYTCQYQLPGTAHFCQTFAVMIYTEKDDNLIKRDYAGNIQKAMDFLTGYVNDVKSDRGQKKWLAGALREVGLTLASFERKIIQARGAAAIVSTYK